MLSAGGLVTGATIYGDYTHAVVLEHNQVVQVVLNNGDTGSHPLHLHGHQFQVIDRAPGYGSHFYNHATGDLSLHSPNIQPDVIPLSSLHRATSSSVSGQIIPVFSSSTVTSTGIWRKVWPC